jgi:hypothetical protein
MRYWQRVNPKATEKTGWGKRINALWSTEGVESSKRGYWTAWVRRFGKFIAPKKLYEAAQQDVEDFYQRLTTEVRAGWQV